MTFECVSRPTCPFCGAEWDDEMIALMDLALGAGCACCNPFTSPSELPDIVCHACRKVLYTAQQPAAEETAVPASVEPLDLTPDP
ncbi:MAG TPA: hypothetical protein VG994_00370 [Steroidobacteraceae bacterium]|nr:hypothetical protein [Steroidobacteraceae bacterium]